MNLAQLKMLERIRGGLDTDANLTQGEICITRFLWLNGYIGACPVEGSDAQQDALSITEKGLAALGLQEIGPVPFLVVRNRYFSSSPVPHKAYQEGREDCDAVIAEFFQRMADEAIMRADLLAREIVKNSKANREFTLVCKKCGKAVPATIDGKCSACYTDVQNAMAEAVDAAEQSEAGGYR